MVTNNYKWVTNQENWQGPHGFFCCVIGGPKRAILAIENTNKYVAINMQFMYNFAEIYENSKITYREFSYFDIIQ